VAPGLAALCGAAVGALLGPFLRGRVVAYAVAAGQPRRLECPLCEYPLRFLLPPSGRCPRCAGRVGPRPGAVEVVAAGVLALLALRIRQPLPLAGYWWVALFGVVLGFVDAAVRRLPDRLTLRAFAGAAVLFGAAAAVEHRPAAGLWAVVSGLAMAAWYLLLALARPSAMGLGDSKLALSLGTALGWLGWFTTIAGTVAGLALAGGYAALLLALRRVDGKDQIPHGPFMLLGALVTILFSGS
jgi:leader peptidase (prepilin peptidase)/N-methyltransferase